MLALVAQRCSEVACELSGKRATCGRSNQIDSNGIQWTPPELELGPMESDGLATPCTPALMQVLHNRRDSPLESDGVCRTVLGMGCRREVEAPPAWPPRLNRNDKATMASGRPCWIDPLGRADGIPAAEPGLHL